MLIRRVICLRLCQEKTQGPAYRTTESQTASKHSYGSLYQVNARLQIEAKIDEVPLDAFTLVLLLLQDEHGVVEQLLQLLVGVVDTKLFKGVQLHC